MAKITDKMLLKKAMEFCDEIALEDDIKGYILNAKQNHLQYPLDKQVKDELKNLYDNGIDRVTKELSYEVNDEIDELWNLLIEKSVICLRFFDKREPFMENGKEQYVYGMKKLRKYHEDYTDFEGMLYGSDSYYRDHVFHVIRVWLLGLYLILNKNSYITETGNRLIDNIRFEGESKNSEEIPISKKDIDKKYPDLELSESNIIKKDKNFYKLYKAEKEGEEYILVDPNSFSREINVLEKISMWTIMALCHDLGYPLEKSKKVLAKTEKMMEAFVSNPHIDRNLRFDGTRDSNNIEIITFASKKMKFIPKKKSRKPKYRASIQDKYKFKYKLSLEDFSHGMISAIIIYKMLIYFIETDNNPDANYIFDNEDARQFYIRRDILRAIASHTCENIYHINVETFPMILFVCDELQEWGRKSWKSMYQGVGNSNVELDISSFNMKKIEYTEKIDMRNALKDQVIANIKRIIEKQYMLYSTTFRDGQYTAQREFDFIKHIRIKVSEVYKSIDTIDIEFSINCNTNNKFELSIKDSGDIEPEENKKTQYLISDIEDLMKPYMANRKYGECRFINECDIKNKGEER